MRRARGYTLIEVVIAMAVFGILLSILATLTAEMRFHEKRFPINFMRHPQVIAVIERLRRDVLDAHGMRPYRETHDGYTMSDKVLILESVQRNGEVQTIVWDFSRPGEVHRRAYDVGVAGQWVARGLPSDFSTVDFDAVTIRKSAYGVRITAKDAAGRLVIDQVLQPRAHE